MKNITAAEIRSNASNLAPLESQKEYRHRLSEFIRMHTARVNALDNGAHPAAVPGNSMLILARTGCGKSYTAARLAEAAGVDLITIDCSSLTRAGYKGCNLGDLIYAAQKNCKDDLFARSILFFDEIDKIYMDGTAGNPQVNFLKLFDGIIQADPNSSRPVTIDVSRMSFLFAGAFAGLEEVIQRRLKPRTIGFNTAPGEGEDVKDLLSLATMADIREYGFMEELLGRMGPLFYIPPLTAADYRTLLKGSSGSICRKYNNLLSASGVTLEITDSACDYVAKEAGRSALGARAVDPIIYNQLSSTFNRLDEDEGISHVTLFCRNDRLSLRYTHGKRTYPDGKEPSKKVITPPDVNISQYLGSDEGIEELCNLALEIFDHPGTKEEKLLRAFLRCTLLFMTTLSETDMILSSLSKLANATEMVDEKSETIYDRIIKERTSSNKRDEEWRNKLREAYQQYLVLEDQQTHKILMSTTRSLRQNWYRGLLDTAC